MEIYCFVLKSDRILFLLFLIAIIFSPKTFSQREIILTASKDNYYVNPFADILFDQAKKLTIEDVAFGKASNKFRPMKKAEANLGYRKETVWLRFTIKNETDENKKWLINLNYGSIDKVSFFIPTADKVFFEKKAGIAYSINGREVPDRLIAFPFILKNSEVKTFFIRIESGRSIPLNIYTVLPEIFYKNEANEYLIRGFLYGGLIILAIYNLFLFFSVKDKSYLLYFFYVLSVCSYLANTDGFAFQYFSLNLHKYNMQNGIVVVSLLIIFGSLFSREFLQVKKISSLIDKVFISFIIFSIIYVIVILTTGTTDSSLTTYLGLLYFIFLVAACIYLSIKGNANATYYLIAVSFFVVGIIFRSFKNIGIIPVSFLTDYGVQIGFLAEMTILSFALGNRINTIRQEEEKEKALIRSRIASDLHDEIGSNLSSISVLSQMIKEGGSLGENEKKQLEDITLTAKETADSIRDIIWFINPEHDKNDNLILKMQDTTEKMLKGICHSFKYDNEKVLDGINLQTRRNLFLIYKEILNNIVKHSAAKNVLINIEDNSSGFQLRIHDDGKGYDKNKIINGDGLKNIEKRIKEINGKMEIKSKPACGTEILLYLLLRYNYLQQKFLFQKWKY